MKLLVVDDEISSIRVITGILDAERLGITEIHTAMSAKEARGCMQENSIDLLLCDIEMPGESGLDLLAWVNEQGFDTACIYMTCYADFSYAQRAIKLGCCAYLLKPIDPEELNRELGKALKELQESRRMRQVSQTMSEEEDNRTQQFWRNLFYDEIPSEREAIREEIERQAISCSADWTYAACLVVVRNWGHDIDQSHRNNRYLVHQLVKQVFPSIVSQNCDFWTIFPFGQHGQMCLVGGPEGETLRRICRKYAEEYLKKEEEQLVVTSVCYLSQPVAIENVAEEMEQLMRLDNSQLKNHGICVHEVHKNAEEIAPDLDRNFARWTSLLENEMFDKANAEIQRFLRDQETNPWFTKKKFRYFLSHYAGMLRGYAEKNSLPLSQMTADAEHAAVFERSDQGPEHMSQWVRLSLRLLSGMGSNSYDPVRATKLFIENHLSEEIDLPQIADNVHLNQDYLTRIFRRETGVSVKSYIVNLRMEKARELLETSRLPIADVAYRVGYYNYTSFNRIFKKTFGVSPQSYRKASE